MVGEVDKFPETIAGYVMAKQWLKENNIPIRELSEDGWIILNLANTEYNKRKGN